MTQLIEEKTEGRVKFDIYWSQTLVPMNQGVDAVNTGIADVACLMPQMEAGKIPLDMAAQLPGFGTDYWAQCMAHWDLMNSGPMLAQYKKYNMRPLANFFVSDYHLISRIPIDTLAELNGRKISGSGFVAQTLTALGAVPIVMSPMEQYEGLQKGTIDGNTAPYGAIHDFKWYEVAKYLELFPFGGRVQPVVINIDSWNKISPADQAMINSLIPDFIQFNIEAFFIEDQPYYPLTDEIMEGVTVTKPSAEDIATLTNVQADMADKWAAEQDKEGLPGTQILNDYRALIDKYAAISTFAYK
jgi:TRAP-type C4-dicarboxylate transport system substrate-binding protein